MFLLIELGWLIQDFLLINNQLELYIPLYLTIRSNSEIQCQIYVLINSWIFMHQWDNKVTFNLVFTRNILFIKNIKDFICHVHRCMQYFKQRGVITIECTFWFFFFNLSCSQKNIIQSSTEWPWNYNAVQYYIGDTKIQWLVMLVLIEPVTQITQWLLYIYVAILHFFAFMEFYLNPCLSSNWGFQ